MATIYLAASVGPGGFEKPCALKVLRPDYSESGDVANVLLHEARFAALLSHPNIVQVFDLGKFGSEYYMVMEWVDGLSLAKLLSRMSRAKQRLPIEVCAQVGIAVAWALDYLRRGVEYEGQPLSLIHRDVSPSNILLSMEGTAKLTDFGIVKVLEAPATTKIGVVKGKYAYMSPEQIRGEPLDHRSDIFSLGVVLFESLTNRRLFSRKTVAGTVAAIHAAKLFPPSQLNPDVPEQLDAVVMRALARRREDRFESAGELVEALQSYTLPHAHRTLASLVEQFRGDQPLALGLEPAAPPPNEGAVDEQTRYSASSNGAIVPALVVEPEGPDDEPKLVDSDEFSRLEDLDDNAVLEEVHEDDEEATRLTPSQALSLAVPAMFAPPPPAPPSVEAERSQAFGTVQREVPLSWLWLVLVLFATSIAATMAFWAWMGGL